MGDRLRPLLSENAAEAVREALVDELWALLHGMAALYMDRFAPFDLTKVTNAAVKLVSGARLRRTAGRALDRMNDSSCSFESWSVMPQSHAPETGFRNTAA